IGSSRPNNEGSLKVQVIKLRTNVSGGNSREHLAVRSRSTKDFGKPFNSLSKSKNFGCFVTVNYNSIEIIILFLYSKQGITIALSCSNSTGNSVDAIGHNGEVCVDQDFITSGIQACYNTSNFINQSKNTCKNFFFGFTSAGYIII